ncbi:hypothetical protein U8P76_06885 [Rhizobium johnstonii]|nr:hypothetical protein U8P76_06885 [Rhizobium johnstonii]
MSIKIQIARAQLGTALDLFIRDRDPYSVHSLACGGSEIVEGLAKEADLPSISTHILQTIPDIDQRKLKRLRTSTGTRSSTSTSRTAKLSAMTKP